MNKVIRMNRSSLKDDLIVTRSDGFDCLISIYLESFDSFVVKDKLVSAISFIHLNYKIHVYSNISEAIASIDRYDNLVVFTDSDVYYQLIRKKHCFKIKLKESFFSTNEDENKDAKPLLFNPETRTLSIRYASLENARFIYEILKNLLKETRISFSFSQALVDDHAVYQLIVLRIKQLLPYCLVTVSESTSRSNCKLLKLVVNNSLNKKIVNLNKMEYMHCLPLRLKMTTINSEIIDVVWEVQKILESANTMPLYNDMKEIEQAMQRLSS